MEQTIKCNNKSSWRKNYPKEYNKALNLGILPGIYEKMGWETKGKIIGEHTTFTTTEQFIKLVTQLGISSPTQWKNQNGGSYWLCCKLKLQKEVAKAMGWKVSCYPNNKNINDWVKYVKELGVNSLAEWRKKENGSYQACRKAKLTGEVVRLLSWKIKNDYSHLKTIEDFSEYARKLGAINLRDWSLINSQSYNRCLKLGLTKEVAKILGWKIRNK